MEWLRNQRWYKRSETTDPLNILLPEKKLNKDELILAIRKSIIAEQDAIILYESYAKSVEDEKAKEVFSHIAEEEIHHVGEFQELLERLKGDEREHLDMGREEVKE